MDIAIKKRRENIAEYILYLWQLEDMMRALQLSPEAIYTQLVGPRGLDPRQENELLVWYMGIADLIRQEGKEQGGHIEHTLHLIAELQKLHEDLLRLPKGERYRKRFTALMPELPRLRAIINNAEVGDIELAFRALYAVMLYRIKGDVKAEKATADVTELISPVIAELADTYRKIENGESDLYEEE